MALIKPSYLEKQEAILPEPSIKIAVNRLLTRAEINGVVDAIQQASKKVLESPVSSETSDEELISDE